MTAVDYSFTKPSIQRLLSDGVTAVGRYVGPPAWGKTITQAEYDALVAAGLEVWLVFEAGADDASGGFNAGTANAHVAMQFAPQGYTGPIYVACDQDIEPGPAMATALDYIRGFGAAVGPARTGVYGEGALIQQAHDAGYATAGGWQSASTSFPGNATTLPITAIQQGLGGPEPGTDADVVLRPLIPTPIAPSPPTPTQEDHMGLAVATVNGVDVVVQVGIDGVVWAKSRSGAATWAQAANKPIAKAIVGTSPVARVVGTQPSQQLQVFVESAGDLHVEVFASSDGVNFGQAELP